MISHVFIKPVEPMKVHKMQTDKIHKATIRTRVESPPWSNPLETKFGPWLYNFLSSCGSHSKNPDFSTVSRVDGNLNSANNMKKGLSY